MKQGLQRTAMKQGLQMILILLVVVGIACGRPENDNAVERVVSAVSGYGNCGTFTDNQICICVDKDFLGQCKVLDAGAYGLPALMGIPNDSLSSLVVGANVKVELYDEANFHWSGSPAPTNNAHYGATFHGNMPTGSCGLHLCADQTSSLRIDYIADDCQNPGPGRAAIFTAANAVADIFNDCVVWPVGFSASSPQVFGLSNDWISSVRTPRGVFVHLCDASNFGAPCFDYGSATQSFQKTSNMQDNGMNDRTSSLSIWTACAHPICTTGTPLVSTCDDCASSICASDPYCCSTAWDASCQSEVVSICQGRCG
jgi:hypothetical protein